MPTVQPDDESDYTQAAVKLGVSEAFLRENIAKLPHYKKSLSRRGRGVVTFSDDHIAQIKRMFEYQPDPSVRMRPTTRRRAS